MVRLITTICLVFTACLSGTLAVAPCDDTLVAKLSQIPECYTGGKVPKLTSSGEAGTHIVWTKDDFPAGVKCVTATQSSKRNDVNYFLNNGSKVAVVIDFQEKGNYLFETGKSLNGVNYRLYVIVNEQFVYGYYRCSEGTANQNGKPQVNVAVNCKYLTNADSLSVVQRAKVCFSKLGIQNLIDVAPCDSKLCV